MGTIIQTKPLEIWQMQIEEKAKQFLGDDYIKLVDSLCDLNTVAFYMSGATQRRFEQLTKWIDSKNYYYHFFSCQFLADNEDYYKHSIIMSIKKTK